MHSVEETIDFPSVLEKNMGHTCERVSLARKFVSGIFVVIARAIARGKSNSGD